MSTLITDTNEVTRFAEAFSSIEFACEVGPTMACGEVEALAGMLRALGEPASADMWIEGHCVADDEGDQHYRPAEGYAIPIDPADLIDIDCCQ